MNWIDTFSSDWLAWLHAVAVSDRETRTLIMLDGAFFPGLYKRLAQGGHGQRACHAVFEGLPGSNDATLEVSPVVVEYQATASVLQEVLRTTDRRPMVTLIKTSESPRQLADRLANWCIVDAGGSFFNFRFPDTRRLPAIARTLTDAQRAQMLGPARAWYCINRFGRWEPLPTSVEALASDDPPRLTDEQFATLVHDSEADEILALLEPDFDDAVRSAPPSWRFMRAQHALTVANRLHLANEQERIACVALSLACEERELEQRLTKRQHATPALSVMASVKSQGAPL